jgi:hypothetical protein
MTHEKEGEGGESIRARASHDLALEKRGGEAWGQSQERRRTWYYRTWLVAWYEPRSQASIVRETTKALKCEQDMESLVFLLLHIGLIVY